MDKEKTEKRAGDTGCLRKERKMADIDGLLLGALQHEAGHPRRSGHILKVTALAGTIGREEGLEEEEQMILEAAAVLHDIGIRNCKEKYGETDPEKLAEESVQTAGQMLEDYGYPKAWIDKILHLVRMHHDYDHIDSKAYQILVEADLWVCALEEGWDPEKIREATGHFRTETGRQLMEQLTQEQPVSE